MLKPSSISSRRHFHGFQLQSLQRKLACRWFHQLKKLGNSIEVDSFYNDAGGLNGRPTLKQTNASDVPSSIPTAVTLPTLGEPPLWNKWTSTLKSHTKAGYTQFAQTWNSFSIKYQFCSHIFIKVFRKDNYANTIVSFSFQNKTPIHLSEICLELMFSMGQTNCDYGLRTKTWT